jgi:predicted peptidase
MSYVKTSRRRFLAMLAVAASIVICLFVVESSIPLPYLSQQAHGQTTPARPTPVPTPSVTGANAFVTRVFTNGQGQSLTYYLYVPYNYSPQRSYPLVLVLHGGGEHSHPNWTAGQNKAILFRNDYVQVWEPGYNVPYNPQVQQHWPSFIVIPQIPVGHQWVNVPVHAGSYSQPAQPATSLLLTKELLDALQKQYQGIDAGRLYITGISLGGYGVWDAIERWPDYFAAAIPIAGAGDPSKAAVLKNLPIWAFQGADDQTVPVSGSRDMIAAIGAAGGHPRSTEYPGAGHGVWGYVYSTTGNPQQNTPGVLPWLFAQHKREDVNVSPA